jgi:hypothetical protein
MWTPALAHYFHLKRPDMLEITLTEYLAMVDSLPKD